MKIDDVILLIITSTVCAILLLTIVSPLITGRVMPEEKARLISNMVLSLVAIIAYRLGQKQSKND